MCTNGNEIYLITHAEAVEAAIRGIKKHCLGKNPDVTLAIISGQSGVPLLVKRLDSEKRYYYLVFFGLLKEGLRLLLKWTHQMA